MENNLQCSICAKVFGYKKNLLAHLKKPCAPTKGKIKCPVPECGAVISRMKLLKMHVKIVHGVEVEEEKLSFNNYKDFEEWKLKVEKDNLCYYAKARRVPSRRLSRTYFNCHRSGYYITESTGKKRIKSQGTNKIDSTCISSIVVVEDVDGAVSVDFCKTHFGHNSNLGRCRLDPSDRAVIAGKISEGVSFQRILDDVRDNVEDISDPSSLLTKKDLFNIQRDFCLNKERSHHSDSVSVSLWVNEMNLLPEIKNPIVCSEINDSNFFLIIANIFQKEMLQKFGPKAICIDTTHGTNEYDLHLTTIVVIDEYGNGFPTCFCVSEKKDTDTWVLLFDKLKSQIGIINTNVFMSDDDPTYFAAWQRVMGPVKHKLLCSWHVDQSWRRQIDSKVKGSAEKKILLRKTLKALRHEPDVEEFKRMVSRLIEDLQDDEETKDFLVYFTKNYLNRVETWAYCHRTGCGLTTNMFLESVHKILKYFYLDGKKNKRMDKCINALVKFTRDSTFSRLIKIAKNKYSSKEDNITRSHNDATKINSSQIQNISENSWKVKSSTHQECYQVSTILQKCYDIDCKLKCRICKICIHMYSCECPNYIIRTNICKHIHACVLQGMQEERIKGSSQSVEPDIHSLATIENALLTNETAKDNILNKLQAAIGLYSLNKSSFTSNELILVEKKVDSVLDLLSKNKRKLKDVQSCEPSNKKAEKQMRFQFKKRNSRGNSSVEANCSYDVDNSLKDILLNKLDIVHTAFDHEYHKSENVNKGKKCEQRY